MRATDEIKTEIAHIEFARSLLNERLSGFAASSLALAICLLPARNKAMLRFCVHTKSTATSHGSRKRNCQKIAKPVYNSILKLGPTGSFSEPKVFQCRLRSR